MNRHLDYFKLGLFVILSLGLIVLFLIILGAGEFLKKEFMAETCFDESVQGLNVGSKVKYKGIHIGTVKSISNPAAVYDMASHYVLVTFSLSENAFLGEIGPTQAHRFKKAVEKGLQIKLAASGITGGTYLEADYYNNPSPPLEIPWKPLHTYIPSHKSNILELGETITRFTRAIEAADLPQIFAGIQNLLDGLNQKTQDLDLATLNTETIELVTGLRATNEKLSRAVDGLKTKGTLKNLEEATQALEDLVRLNTDPLTRTLDNFHQASEHLKQLTRELKLYPGRLLLEEPPPAPLEPGRKR